eukprot:CAMPEP_0172624398 /NCGR_PEP_ID=MMETSP1068-20121228/136311_1 /TAXON_ID=35684 /ORGANISM="Pseudopedinella elastica, Strain CCMP716" /LENGTH=182 /DNA_ID=CAMNT_0013433343 /DNA_START=84 /DNA_END=628 /DNA_ORIENTATION=-
MTGRRRREGALPALPTSPMSAPPSVQGDGGPAYWTAPRSRGEPSAKASDLGDVPQRRRNPRRLSWSDVVPIKAFMCPISGRLLKDPVVTADGHSYERSEIESWFKLGKASSPLTGATLPHTQVVRNHGLRAAVIEYLERLKEHGRQQGDYERAVEGLEEKCLTLEGELALKERERLGLARDL